MSGVAITSDVAKGQWPGFTVADDCQSGYGTVADGGDLSGEYGTSGQGTLTSEQTDVFNGNNQSIKMNVPATAGNLVRCDFTITATDMVHGSGRITFLFKPSEETVNGLFDLFISHNSYSDYAKLTVNWSTYVSGWQQLTLTRDDYSTVVGTVDWTAITDIRIVAKTVDNAAKYCLLGGVWINTYEKPRFLITFDDGWAGVYNQARSVINTAGLTASCYLTRGLVPGTGLDGGYMTNAQIQAIYDDGWDICNHFNDHSETMENKTQAEITAGLQDCSNYLTGNGWTRAYNHGAYIGTGGGAAEPSQKLQAGAAAAGMLTMTTVNAASYFYPTKITERFDGMYRRQVGIGIAASTVITQIDKVVKYGGTGMIYAHDIQDAESISTDWATASLQTVVDYLVDLKEKGLIDVMTISEWYAAINGARLDESDGRIAA